MKSELDRKYESLALTALHNGLADVELNENISVKVSPREIVRAFDYSGRVIRRNDQEENILLIAEAVFASCIRLVRCAFFPSEAHTVILHGDEYTLSVESQLDNLRRNMKDLESSL